jgi:catechol 2,3-dioxygenase-like lactoylglutathione lyase family enzyme
MRLFMGLLTCCLSGFLMGQVTDSAPGHTSGDESMRLGNFSVSLAVKDIAKSREFYEKLGFHVILGNQKKNWLILQNETCTIGLFQGMFSKNTMTFNPGWDRSCNTLADFDDVRDIQRKLKQRGLTLAPEADDSTTGPASLMVLDPDGNPILIDQHVPRPQK